MWVGTWTDAGKMLARKYICTYILCIYFPEYICIYVPNHFIISQIPLKPLNYVGGVNITRVQEYWSRAHSTYYHLPVYSSCLDASIDNALYWNQQKGVFTNTAHCLLSDRAKQHHRNCFSFCWGKKNLKINSVFCYTASQLFFSNLITSKKF